LTDVTENAAVTRAATNASDSWRVLIYGINYAPEPIGVGRYSGEMGRYFAQQGLAVEVITAVPHYPGWSPRDGYRNRYRGEQVDGVRLMRCPLLLRKEMRGLWRMLAPLSFAITSAPVAVWRILITRPHTVLCVEPTLFSAPIALLAAKIVGAKTVLHVQDLEVDAAFAIGHLHGGLLQKLANAVERMTLRNFDAVVTISLHMQTQLESKGVPAKRLNLVRNWIDVEKIRPLDGPSTYRDELALPVDAFVALYAGNIGPKQALSVILEAAQRSREKSGLVFVIAGDGPEKKRLVAQYGALPNVRFLPIQPEERLCDLLADVHLLPQDRGAADLVLPSKLGGMLASGKPSIVMADPGTELYDFLGDGSIILPPGNCEALAAAIARLMDGANTPILGSNGERIAALDSRRNLPAFKKLLVSA
jgi:colanic acid biosynthesis glycosyl transferase WcaI